MPTARDDLVELFDYVWQRFRTRMAGLTDDEWRWEPVSDARVTLRWRLEHIADVVGAERTGPWLGLPASPPARTTFDSADDALAGLDEAYASWRAKLAATTDTSLAEPLGAVGGPYGGSSRYSFGLHIVDELIHHTAEAALLRDLYAGSAAAR